MRRTSLSHGSPATRQDTFEIQHARLFKENNDQQLSFCKMYDGGGARQTSEEEKKSAVQQEKHPHKAKHYKI